MRLAPLTAITFCLCAAAAGASPAPDSGFAVVTGAVTDGDSHVYRIHVVPTGRTVVVVLPNDARDAALEVNGVVRQRARAGASIGLGILGHAAPTLTLAGLARDDRVSVIVRGSSSGLRFADADLLTLAHGIGLASGAYYAALATLAIVQLVALIALRDPAIAWYLGFTLSMLGLEFARNDALPLGTNLAAQLLLRAAFMLCILGFSAVYLKLRTAAPRLFALAVLLNIVPSTVIIVEVAVAHVAVPIVTLSLVDLAGLLVLFVAAVVRRREGYAPATYLAVGLLGLPVVLTATVVSEVTGWPLPFLNPWGFEIGSSFDVLAFSIAIVMRFQVHEVDRESIRNALYAATYDANHDGLTGLLNRRGLETRLAALHSIASTLLYVDLDGFKAVNDDAGHAAGDATLKVVAHIIREAVGGSDVVARVGGDEFVVLLVDCLDGTNVARVIARITSEISNYQPLADHAAGIGASVGRATMHPDTPLAATIAAADADAYRVKAEHRATALQRYQ